MTCPPRLLRRCAVALAAFSAVTTVTSCSVKIEIGRRTDTYYVSPSGNDAASGTSPASAWRTLSRVNSAVIPPGAQILLHGGDRFKGQLRLGEHDAGSGSKPVSIGSYGTGTATIYAQGESGINVFDTAGLDIHDLKLIGSGKTGNGINFYSDLPAGKRLSNVSISDVQIHGFRNGIAIGGKNTAAGFADIQITDSISYGNVDTGLLLFGPAFNAKSPAYANQDVLISRVVTRGNLGDPANKTSNTGNGIVLGSVSHGSVTRSTATGNGGKGKAGEEGVGIWTYDSTGITISHSLSYGNKTRNHIDGGGFDLDENTTDSTLEDNLSYGNDGPGYLVYSPIDNAGAKNDVIRNNISSDDVLDKSLGYGGITVTGYVSDIAVYQNTVVTASSLALRIAPTLRRVVLANNIFATQSAPILKAAGSVAPGAVTFLGNDYYSAGSWQMLWGAQAYRSLPAWQAATSQETRNGQSTGHALAPQLAGPVFGLAAENPDGTAAAYGFELASGSPLSGAGLDLAALGLAADTTNYLGQAQAAQHPNVGAL